jgi:hypothetical protein
LKNESAAFLISDDHEDSTAITPKYPESDELHAIPSNPLTQNRSTSSQHNGKYLINRHVVQADVIFGIGQG